MTHEDQIHERALIEVLKQTRVDLYRALQARDLAEDALTTIRDEAMKALIRCNEARELFDAWILKQAGIEED